MLELLTKNYTLNIEFLGGPKHGYFQEIRPSQLQMVHDTLVLPPLTGNTEQYILMRYQAPNTILCYVHRPKDIYPWFICLGKQHHCNQHNVPFCIYCGEKTHKIELTDLVPFCIRQLQGRPY